MAEERLHKLLAQAGVASRRKAEEMIVEGRVRVNGETAATLGAKADPERDTIEVDGQPIKIETHVYLVLYKPRGYVSDRDETGEHKTALDLVPHGQRLFAAGRLDLDSEGLLLITNDGDLTFHLTHPRYEHEKEYLALVAGKPDGEALAAMKRGVRYQDQTLRVDRVTPAERRQPFGEAGRDQTWLRIILHEGKKREIRHICSSVGHPVMRLVRIRIGPIELGNLKSGVWRSLTVREIQALKAGTRLPEGKGAPQRQPGGRRPERPPHAAPGKSPKKRVGSHPALHAVRTSRESSNRAPSRRPTRQKPRRSR